MSENRPASEAIEQAIVDAATSPKSYEVDGEKVTMRDVSEIVAADEHLRRRRLAKNPLAALRMFNTTTQGPAR